MVLTRIVKNEHAESEVKYLDHGDYLTFSFERNRRLRYRGTVNNYMHTLFLAKFTWRFNSEDKIIEIYKEKEMYLKLKPVSKREIDIESRYSAGQHLLKTTELMFVRMK